MRSGTLSKLTDRTIVLQIDGRVVGLGRAYVERRIACACRTAERYSQHERRCGQSQKPNKNVHISCRADGFDPIKAGV